MKKYTIAFGILLSLVLTTCYGAEQGHKEIREIVSMHSVFSGIPITAVDKYAVVLKIGDNFATGVHDSGSKQIFIAKIEKKDVFRHTVMHEACHYIWDHAKPELQYAYSKAYQIHGVSVSRYGRTNLKENFAELCARINGSAHRNFFLPEGYLETSDQFDLANLIIDQWKGNGIVK